MANSSHIFSLACFFSFFSFFYTNEEYRVESLGGHITQRVNLRNFSKYWYFIFATFLPMVVFDFNKISAKYVALAKFRQIV